MQQIAVFGCMQYTKHYLIAGGGEEFDLVLVDISRLEILSTRCESQ